MYPEPAPRGFDPLRYVARYFDLVEINSSFYRPPARSTVESWAARVRDRERFRFTAKAHRSFTHEEGAEAAGPAEAKAFAEAFAPLAAEGRLGAILFQFPHWFADLPASRERLRRIADGFRGAVPLTVEIRHVSWLNREPMTFLHDVGFGFANIDLPPGKGNPPPTAFATSGVGYVRLHGRNAAAWFAKDAGRDEKYDYHYGGAEVDEWVRRVRTLRGKTLVTYVVTNNHFRGQAPANALQIMARLANRKVPLPKALAEAFPELLSEGEVAE